MPQKNINTGEAEESVIQLGQDVLTKENKVDRERMNPFPLKLIMAT